MEEVKTRILRDQLGPALAEAAGVDFDGAETVSEAPAAAARPAAPRRARAEAGAGAGGPPERRAVAPTRT